MIVKMVNIVGNSSVIVKRVNIVESNFTFVKRVNIEEIIAATILAGKEDNDLLVYCMSEGAADILGGKKEKKR
jgi:hypothetical protein